MKLAIITDDGKTISQHFGRARHFLVVTLEEGKETGRELRDKLGHHQFAGGEEGEHHGAHHGTDAGAHHKHSQMAGNIADCEAVICGGMGMGAYESMRRLNIRPIVTDLQAIDQVIKEYAEGKLVDHTELLH